MGGLSPIWIGFNALVSLYFAGSCLNNLTKQKSIWITYLIFGAVAGFLYALNETYNNETIFIAFYVTFIFTFIISKLLSKSDTVDDDPVKDKKVVEEDLKKLSNFKCSFDENIGTRIENVQELNNINFNITVSNYDRFSTEDLEKIFENKGTVREKYLYNYQKNNPKEKVNGRYSLPEENSNEYDELENGTESNLKINNRSLLEILNERIQEKNKVKK